MLGVRACAAGTGVLEVERNIREDLGDEGENVKRRRLRRGQGRHVDLAAPFVLWVVKINGLRHAVKEVGKAAAVLRDKARGQVA